MQELYCIEKMAASGIHIEEDFRDVWTAADNDAAAQEAALGRFAVVELWSASWCGRLACACFFCSCATSRVACDFFHGFSVMECVPIVHIDNCKVLVQTKRPHLESIHKHIFSTSMHATPCAQLDTTLTEPNLKINCKERSKVMNAYTVQQRSFQGAWAQASRRRTLACSHVSTTRQRCMAQSSVNHRALQTLAQSFLSLTSSRHNSFSRQPLEIPTELRARLPRMYRRTRNRALPGTGS